METITQSAKETFELGKKIGSDLIESSKKGPKIFALTGDLGSGKTTFLQGFAAGIGVKNRIISPTFILMKKYDMQNFFNGSFYHLDLYRLEGDLEREVRNLGLFDIWQDEKNIVAIEWAEKIKDIMPVETVWIKFENINESDKQSLPLGGRKITYK